MRARDGVRGVALVAVVALAVSACGSGNTSGKGDPGPTDIGDPASIDKDAPTTGTSIERPTLTSPAFIDGEPIPLEFACTDLGGDNVSPALEWSGLGDDIESVALVMDDPDAPVDGGFVHWVAVDLDPSAGGLEQGATVEHPGANGMGEPGYFGPCPPAGDRHTYVFTLYAYRDAPEWPELPTRDDVLATADDAAATAVLTGEFQRSQ